jgi:hypothetical protein
MSVQPVGNTPEQFGAMIAASLASVRSVVKARKIEAE